MRAYSQLCDGLLLNIEERRVCATIENKNTEIQDMTMELLMCR